MSTMITALRTTLVLISLLGYVQIAAKKVRPEFSLGLVSCSIGSTMFFAGILNIMPESAWAVCFAGIVLFLRAIWKKDSFRPLLCPGVIFILICAGWMLYLLYGQKFTHYDNFSHWGVVTKVMLQNDRFPTASDASVQFQSYPLGSAAFIYYICHLTGQHAEWLQMYAQALLIASCLTGLFAFAHRPLTEMLAAVVALFMLVSLDMYTMLLVDVLLPAVAAGGIMLCIFYQAKLDRMLWWTIPYTVFLVAVKNSGAFFAVCIAVYVLAFIRDRRKHLLSWSICALCPALTMLLWQKHVKLVFANGLMAKHSISLSKFQSVFAEKTPESIKSIAVSMLRTVFSSSNQFFIILILLAALYLLTRFVLRKDLRAFWQNAALIILSYSAYMIGTFLMYLFSMPLGEATGLAGYIRYHFSILLFVAVILFAYGAGCIDDLPISGKKGILAIAAGAALAMVCIHALSPKISYLRRSDNTGNVRYIFDDLIEQGNVPTGKKYAFIVTDDQKDSSYLNYIAQYLLEPEGFSLFGPNDLLSSNDDLTLYDYLIVLYDTEQSRDLMERFFGDPELRVAQLNTAMPG